MRGRGFQPQQLGLGERSLDARGGAYHQVALWHFGTRRKQRACADDALVADLDLDQRQDWLDLFPFFDGRRPECYRGLVEELLPDR